jgi:hypothetical protein
MAKLSNQEVQKLYQERPRKKEVDIGITHQDRLRFHTETVISKDKLSPYYRTYEKWIISNKPELLPKDKAERFKQLLTVPLPTIELTESIFSQLSNVFTAQDAFHRYDFTKPDIEEDWMEYLDCEFWKTQGFQAMINAIDSIWVLDLPEQKGEKPEPKDRLIDISSIIDISVDIHNVCQYLIFILGEKMFVYDDEKFMVYDMTGGRLALLPEQEIKHGLGYTPARMMWTDALMSRNLVNKKAPLTNVLGDLDWLLTVQVFKKYMEIGNSYPITVAVSKQQNYLGSDQEDNRGTEESERKTAGGNLVGPGSFFEVDPPLTGEYDAMANPVKLITPDVTNLTYHDGAVIAKRDAIYYSVVGKQESQTKEAVNEKQVMASFESSLNILRKIARNFELIQTFADKCKCDIRYGKDILRSLSIDYGSKFFMKNTSDLIDELNTAKTNGSHSSITSAIMDEITETKYRNDSRGLDRAKIIQELDPLPDKTQDEAEKILDKKGITLEQFIIKSQLINFVKRFEREQGSLVEFGSAIDYGKKIESIYEAFEEYAKEIIGEEPEEIEVPEKEEDKPPVKETDEEVLIKTEELNGND